MTQGPLERNLLFIAFDQRQLLLRREIERRHGRRMQAPRPVAASSTAELAGDPTQVPPDGADNDFPLPVIETDPGGSAR